jgi:hypothetical protein
MDIIQLLQGQLGEGVIDQLAGNVGESKETTQAAANGIFSALLNGINKNISQEGGGNALLSALDKDHDGSILDNIGDLLSGNTQAANPNTLNATGILQHVLGGNQSNVVDAISKMTGMDSSKAMQMLMTLAPMVLGTLGKLKSQPNVGGSGLLDLITKTTQTNNQQNAHAGIFEKLLDSDGDGSVMDDILNMGAKSLLGGLFKS